MGFGGKKSSSTPAPAQAAPVVTENNNNVPDDAEKRGLPVRQPAVASKPLLAGDDGKKNPGMLY